MPVMYTLPFLFLLKYSAEQTENPLTVPTEGLGNAPDLAAFLQEKDIVLTPAANVEEVIRDNEYSVGLIILSDYQAQLAAGRSAQVVIVIDPRKTIDFASGRLQTALDDYNDALRAERLQQKGLSEEFLEPLVVEERRVATASEASASRFSVFLPIMIFSMGLNVGIPVAVACIAGEKKTQTLEILLFTSVNRAHLLLGKWLALLGSILFNLFLLVSSLFVTFLVFAIGIFTLLPTDEMNASTQTTLLPTETYSFQPAALLLIVLIILLLVALGALLELIISTWARNDEEAYSYMSFLGLFGFVLAIMGISSADLTPKLWQYAIPFVGAMFSTHDLLSNRLEVWSLLIMFLSTFACIGLVFYLTVWLFSREEVVFRS